MLADPSALGRQVWSCWFRVGKQRGREPRECGERVTAPSSVPETGRFHQTKPGGGREGSQRMGELLKTGSTIGEKENKTDLGGEQEGK